MVRKIFVADFETEPFDDSRQDNYRIDPLFVNLQEFFEGTHSTFILTTKNIAIDVELKMREGIYGNCESFKSVLKKLCSRKNPCFIYFHNLRFDFKFLQDYLPKNFVSEIVQNNGKILEIKLFKEYKIWDKRIERERIQRKYVMHIRDSLLLLLVSIDELGKSLHFPKGKINYSSLISAEFIEYCRQDCRILRKSLWNLSQFVIQNFIPDFSMEKMPLTLPSLAKKCWEYLLRQEFGENAHTQVFDRYALEYEEFFRQYYFGGRVEVFNFALQRKKSYNDVNSFYPAIMFKNSFPLPPYEFISADEWDYPIRDLLENPRVFAIFGEINEQQPIPLVPIRMNNKIIFPVGHKICFLFREEYQYLTQTLHQSILIKKILLCDSWEYIFKDFVKLTYFRRKEEKDKGERGNQFLIYLLKIFQNSLYGKFAEGKLKEHIQFMSLDAFQELPEEKHQELLEKIDIVEYGDEEYAILREKREHRIDINIFIAMRITALCRLELHKKMVKMVDLSYVDTDSLVGSVIEDSTELGHLKVEFNADKFQALGCKEYVYCIKKLAFEVMNCNIYFDDLTEKMKGFGKIKTDDFEKFVVEYLKPKRQWRPAGFFEIIERGLNPHEIVVFDKEKQAFYDKRWINPDLSTRPFDIDNEDIGDLILNNQQILRKMIKNYKTEVKN